MNHAVELLQRGPVVNAKAAIGTTNCIQRGKFQPRQAFDQQARDTGHTQIALEVSSLSKTRAFMEHNGINISHSFDHPGGGAVYIKDPDDNLIEMDRYR